MNKCPAHSYHPAGSIQLMSKLLLSKNISNRDSSKRHRGAQLFSNLPIGLRTRLDIQSGTAYCQTKNFLLDCMEEYSKIITI